MNILIYGNTSDKELIVQHMKTDACMAYRLVQIYQTEVYDEYIDILQSGEHDMVIVSMDGAAGMEGVIAVKNLYPYIPVMWLSNDKNFVAQSYRLGVNYFSIKPINERTLRLAFSRCQRKEEKIC